jgi:Family of unknown function (DUF6518)
VKKWNRALLVAVVVGVLVGIGDLLLQKWLPYPWANLANSGAVWAVAAFIIGRWVGGGWQRPAVAGAVLLIVAVESYYVAAAIVQHDNLANAWSSAAAIWVALGVVAGAVFGIAGAWSRSAHRPRRLLGFAAVAAVFVGEALLQLGRSTNADEATNHRDLLLTASIEVALALGIPAVLIVCDRQRLRHEK